MSPIRALSLIAALVLAIALPARAQSVDDLSLQLDRLDAELQAIRSGLVRGGALPPGVNDLASLEGRIAELTRQVQTLQAKVDAIAADAANRFGDIEFRLTELEGGDISLLPPVEPLGSTIGAPRQTLGTLTTEVAVVERTDLSAAVEDVRSGRFDVAEERLQRFVATYPGSPLTSEAQYWLGESRFRRGQYRQAARAYLSGYETNRAGSFAAENLLGLGMAFARLNQIQDACLTLAEVRRQFPTAPRDVLDVAADEAARLRCG